MDTVVQEQPGASAILSEGNTFEVEGKQFRLKRLGIKQTLTAINLLKQAAAYGYHDLSFLTNLVETLTAQRKEGVIAAAALLFGITELQDSLLTWVASVIEDSDGKVLTLEDLCDPDRFPMSSTLDILVAFLSHQDLGSFFSKLILVLDKILPQVTSVVEKLVAQTEEKKTSPSIS